MKEKAAVERATALLLHAQRLKNDHYTQYTWKSSYFKARGCVGLLKYPGNPGFKILSTGVGNVP